MEISRRDFLKYSLLFGGGLFSFSLWEKLLGKKAQNQLPLKEALFYEKLPHNRVHCLLCPRSCLIAGGERGNCQVRENRKGKLYSLVYGNPCSLHPDPIEKKPFFHVLPGSRSYSFATAGCNLRCLFCQNWQISQARPEEVDSINLLPEQLVEEALASGCRSITGTYTEPVIFYEYLLEAAQAAKKQGLPALMVSAGYINPEPLKLLCRNLTAIKIDLKSFDLKFYRDLCNASLEPVLNSLQAIKQSGVWLEIVNLLIPTYNDNPKEIKELSLWVKNNLGDKVPLHFTRFFPVYRLKNLPPTPALTLEKAREIALSAGLKYVYLGNLGKHPGENTYCPKCRKLLILRSDYLVEKINLAKGKCPSCGETIPGYWNKEGVS